MTIAAGFKVMDGVLLCADTEYSGGVKLYKEKIFRHHFNGGSLAVAIAGNATNAGMAFRDCCHGLTLTGGPYGAPEIEAVIRNAVRNIYDQYVAPANESDNAEFDLIVGVWIPGWPPYLLASNRRGVDEVDYFVARGSGWYLSDYIIRQAYNPLTVSLEQIAIIALQFLSAAKRHCEGVSGPSQFLTIYRGAMHDVFTRDFGIAEKEIEKYEHAVSDLLLRVGNAALEESVIDWHLEQFAEKVREIHRTWKTDAPSQRDFFRTLTAAPVAQPDEFPTRN